MVPQNHQKLETEEQIIMTEKLIDIMEDDDKVQNVWHNWEQEALHSTKAVCLLAHRFFYIQIRIFPLFTA